MLNKPLIRQTNSKAHAILSLCLLLILGACSESGVNVTTRFDNTQDVKEGTVVYFEDQAVGQVNEVSNTENGSLVQLNLNEDATKKISSTAAVVVNRLKEGAPLEIYNPGNTGGAPMVANQELKGLDSMFQLGAWMVGDAIKVGSGSVSQYVDAFQKYLHGDKFQSDKAQMQKQINQATDAAKDAMKTVEQDVAEAVGEIAASEGEMAKAVEEFGNELSPVVKELSKSGTLLMEQLEKFTKGLENTQQGEQQAGKNFMDSLLATLEKLNQSLEEGAAESADTPTGNTTE